ncbi:unnamed protein product [Tilletia caries]|uniref:Proteophosphoglycan ppg4 n=1 Tax=Tilletia caries TaxID=13290 RepID=A0ABN7J3J4_9BASI|nr:unnamed protein product [Tilletia caries]
MNAAPTTLDPCVLTGLIQTVPLVGDEAFLGALGHWFNTNEWNFVPEPTATQTNYIQRGHPDAVKVVIAAFTAFFESADPSSGTLMPSASTSAFEFAPYVPATSTSPMNQIIPVSAPSNNGGADQSGIAAFDFSNFMAPSTSGSASMSLPTNQPPHTSPPSTASGSPKAASGTQSASPSQDPSKRHNRGRGAVQKRRLEPRASQESSKKKGKRADPAAASAAESSSSEAATSVALRGGYRLRGGDVRSRSAATSSTGSATSSTGSPRSRSAATASRSAAATSSTGSATSSPGSPLSRSVATSSASSSLVVAPGSARASDVAVVTAPTALAATSRPARNSNAAMRAGTPMPWRYLGLVRWHDGATDGVPLTSDEANIEAERSAVPSSSSGPDGSNDGSDSRTKRLSHLREAWAVNSAPRSDTNTSAGPAISPSTFVNRTA